MKKATKTKVTKDLQIVKQNLPAVINPADLLNLAIKQGAGIDTLERLLTMREKIKAEEAEGLFRRAMSAFQSKIPIVNKSKAVMNKAEKGGGKRYSYATLDSIVKQIQPYLKKYDLSYQIKTVMDKGVTVIVTACHIAGHKEETEFTAPVQVDAYMTEPQKWAAAMTYAKRYAFCNAFGILTGDEDTDAGEMDTPKKSAEKQMDAAVELQRVDDLKKKASDLIESSQTIQQLKKRDNDIINIVKSLPDDKRKELSADYKRRLDELMEKADETKSRC